MRMHANPAFSLEFLFRVNSLDSRACLFSRLIRVDSRSLVTP